MHHNYNVEGSHNDAPSAEAELLAQVREEVNEPEWVALTAAPDPSQTQQPAQAQTAHHVRLSGNLLGTQSHGLHARLPLPGGLHT